MTEKCPIVEDLLPLYSDGLLHDDTLKWVEEHLNTCDACRDLATQTSKPMVEEKITSPINDQKMLAKISVKLSLYQVVFVGISFFMAIHSSLVNDGLGFILSYTVLGLITYLFYKNAKIVIAITFMPVFIWMAWEMISTSVPGVFMSINYMKQLLSTFIGLSAFAFIHLLFALIGVAMGAIILKLKEGRDKR